MSGHLPSVSVVLAVLDEREFIDAVLTDLLSQDYGGPYEVIVADGGSTDGTRERLEAWARERSELKVIDNPRMRQAFGLNRAAAMASGEVLVRADGHTTFAQDYVSSSVRTLLETGGAVGGPMNPVGRNRFSRAVAAAMNSPLTMGPGRFHHASSREKVDTVYLGAFPATDFLELGGFRSFPSGSSEDADFYYRWRISGREVYVDPDIRSVYAPRKDVASLWRQYWRYGRGKAEMWWVNGRPPSWRPLAPLALAIGLIAGSVLGGLTGLWWPVLGLMALWLGGLAWVGASSEAGLARVMLVAGTMHIAYGVGMLTGLATGALSTRSLREQAS